MSPMDLRRVGVVVGLVLLLVVDAAVVGWALWPRGGAEGAGATAPTGPAPSDGVSPSPSPSPTPTPTAMVAAPLSRFVVALSSTEAWFTTVGSCGTPGTGATTVDGGKTWTAFTAPGTLTRVKPSSGTAAFVIGGDKDCDLRLWTTADGGETWSDPGSAAKGWARNPLKAVEVHSPRDEMVTPCGDAQVLDFSADGGSRATALCTGGLLRATTDNGDTWADVLTSKAAVSVSGRADGTGVIALVDSECAGVVVQPYAGTQLGKGDCVQKAVPVSGRTSVSTSGRAVWLLAGKDVWTTKELGSDWTAAGSVG